MPKKIEFEEINEAYLFGFKAKNGNKSVEVIRAYEGEWLVFKYEGAFMIQTGKSAEYMPKSAAMKIAKEYIK